MTASEIQQIRSENPTAALRSGEYVFVFTDLVDSTRLTFSLPPHIWGPARDAFFALQASIAQNCNLLWLSPRGDGKFLVFTNAGDAARFAATLLPEVARRNWGGVPIALRVGIAFGHADFLPTEAGGVQEDFVGNPLNLAARVCSVARPGEVLFASGAYRDALAALGDNSPQIHFTDLGEVDLKGLPPERVWRLNAPGVREDFPPLVERGNLEFYRMPSAYFGRDDVVAQALGDLDAGPPVLTLLGDPGQGKTRLSLEVGRRALGLFQDGVWFVPLDQVRQGALVAETVAAALSITPQPGREIGAVLREHLKPRRLLLILDNCEQLLMDEADEGLLDFVEHVVITCPQVKLMTTSRQALDLNVNLQRLRRLPDLPVPSEDTTQEQLRDYPSVQLLCDRLEAASGGTFALDASNAPEVASICRHLDGVPLFLELAAGQMARDRTLTQIAADVYQMLQTRARGYADRQRTLDNLLDFSCDQIPDERDFFYRLGVFGGRFRAEDASAVCLQADADQRLRQLVQRSLVKQETAQTETGEEPRFRLLQAPAVYGRQRLGAEVAHWQKRHAGYFLDYARAQDAHLQGTAQKQAGAALAEMLSNLRIGMDWAVDSGDDILTALYGKALGRFLFTRGLTTEGRDRLEAARNAARRAGDQYAEAACLSWLAAFARLRGDAQAARPLEEQALALWHDAGDQGGEAASLNGLGVTAERLGERAASRAYHEQALALYRDLHDAKGEAEALYHLAYAAQQQGEFARAKQLYQESLTLREQVGDLRGMGDTLGVLGTLAFDLAEYAEAKSLYERALAIKRELSDREGEAWGLMVLGTLAHLVGEAQTAQEMTTEALSLYQKLGMQRMEGQCYNSLAEWAIAADDPSTARQYAAQALARLRVVQDWPGIATALVAQATAAWKEGDFEAAIKLGEEALEIRRTSHVPLSIASSLMTLGLITRDAGRIDLARQRFGESLKLCRDLDHRYAVAMLLENLGGVAGILGEDPMALLLAQTSCAVYAELELPIEQEDYRDARRLAELSADALPFDQITAVQTNLQSLTIAEIVDMALAWATNTERLPGSVS